MAWNRWLGDVPGVAQVTKVTPANVEIGDTFTLTCNRKSVSFIATAATVANVVAGLVAAINAARTSVPEWAEMTPSAGTDADDNVTHLVLTGLEDGTPFTVTSGHTNLSASQMSIQVRTVQQGSAARNAKQRITLAGPPTSGNFTITFAGQTTGNIAYNASAATVDTALEGLSTIGAGNVVTTKNADGDWTIEFSGSLAGLRQPTFTGTNVSLAGAGSVAVSTYRQGRAANYAKGPVYSLTITGSVRAFRFKYTGGSGVVNTAYYSSFVSEKDGNVSADDIRVALQSIQAPVVLTSDTATQDPEAPRTQVYTLVDVIGEPGGPFTITIRDAQVAATIDSDGTRLFIDDDTIVLEDPADTTADVALEFEAAAATAGIDEQQAIVLVGGATGGTFTLTFNGSTTAGIAYNAAAGTVQTAINGLSSVTTPGGSVTVTGSGTLADPYLVTFATGLAATNVKEITGSGASLTGAQIKVEVIQDAAPAVNEQQQIEIVGGTPTGGTFTLNPGGLGNTSALDHDTTAALVDAAIEGVVGAGTARVTGGPFPDLPIVIEFLGLASPDIALSTGDASSLTASNTQTLTVASNTVNPTGPYHIDNANNWSLGHTPLATEDLYFSGNRPIKYGLTALATIVPNSIVVAADFTGEVGLEYDNGDYIEYRPRKCQIGGSGTFKVFIGRGEGSGSKLLGFDFQTAQVTVVVEKSGTPDIDRPAVLLLINNSSADVNVSRGSVGIAYDTGETSSLGTLRESYIKTQDSDSFVVLGAGVTMPTVLKYAGALECNCAITTAFTQYGGDTDFNGTGAMTGLSVLGGVLNFKSSGTLGGNPIVGNGGILNFDGDPRAKTVTNPIDVYGDESEVVDTNKVVGSLVIDYNFTTRQPKLGTNYRITRGATA